jgi:uncharacterized protein DUF3562
MKLRTETKRKVEHGKVRLAVEFWTTPPAEIAKRVDDATHRLLEEAHFDDYVPVLAQRLVRDDLLDRQKPH